VYTGDPSLTIQVVQEWDSRGQRISMSDAKKVPTEISYVEETGAGASSLWGYQIGAGLSRCSNFKLGLQAELLNAHVGGDDISTSSTIIEPPETLLPYTVPTGKDAAKLAEDYLSHLYKYLMQILTAKYTSRLIITPIHFVLTVPAVWDETGQDLTRKVARLAGIGMRDGDTMELIKEPEAAALYAFKTLPDLRTMVSNLVP
jgi:hypothetical protein